MPVNTHLVLAKLVKGCNAGAMAGFNMLDDPAFLLHKVQCSIYRTSQPVSTPLSRAGKKHDERPEYDKGVTERTHLQLNAFIIGKLHHSKEQAAVY